MAKDQSKSPGGGRKKKKGFQKKLLIGFAMLLGAIILLLWLSRMPYYDTPSELLAKGNEAYGKTVRVKGTVTPGSVVQDPSAITIRFTIGDGKSTLPVVYKGVVPDAFEPGRDAVVEGRYMKSGTFDAAQLLVQCPSKFEAKTGQ